MHTKSLNHQSQSGTGLIEVLVAILVLAVGMLGMSKLNALLIRDGGTANNRAVAVSLVQEKLDDLRGFKWISPTSSYGEDCGAGIFCFSEIATNAGGYEAPVSGTLRFPTGAVTVGNTSFNRTWTVVDNGSFKLVTVTVNWTDQNGAASEVLTSAIWGDDAGVTAFGAGGPGIALGGPKVPYTPKGVPDVVPITISDGTQRETSKPLPDVSSKGLSISTEFSSVNYDSDGEQTQEDFKTLNCTCQFAASASANPAAYYTYKDGELFVKYPKTAADKVNKITGIAITSQGDSQDPLCNTCCADHHDSEDASVTTTATTALFDPERPSGDYESNSDHKHYYYTNASQPNLGLTRVAPASGNDYLEACRFLRVDGIFRIMQDWRLSDVTVMPKDGYLVDGSTALSNYKTYVENVVKGQAKTDGGTNTTWSKSALSTRDLSNRNAGPIQLLARGIYVDKVYSDPRTLDTVYYGGIVAGTTGLDKIPFNEVNLTLLASWASSNTDVVTVTNEAIKDITSSTSEYYGVYNRGRANVVSGNGGNADVTAYVLPSNSGLTGGTTRSTYAATVDYDSSLTASGTITYDSEIGIDRHDHRSALRKSDFINIARTGTTTAGSRTVFGTLQSGNTSGLLNSVTVTGPGSCSITSPTGNSTFTCSVADTYAGALTLATSQTDGFLSATSCALTAGSTDVNCGTYSVYGPTINVSGTCNGNGQSCSSKTLSLTAGTGTTCFIGNAPYCTVPIGWTGTISVSDTAKNAIVDIGAINTTTNCSSGSSSDSLEISTPVGPGDAPSSFVMCVK